MKICGIGHVEDALAAARAGADAIGLVFHPQAPRNVTQEQAAEILVALPPFVTAVGLFVDATAEAIRQTAWPLGLRQIQLNGNESAEMVAELREFTIIKAIRVDPVTFGSELEAWRAEIRRLRMSHLQGFVLDTAGAAGGSGQANDWETVRRHRQRGDLIGMPNLIAAGGLTAATVGAVIRDLHPWAVDVSTGVESSPGRKSPEKIEQFIRAVDEAVCGLAT